MIGLKHAFIGLAALSLGGCLSLLPEPAPADTVYRLSPPQAHVAPMAGAKIVRIDRPNASTVFETRDIIISPDSRRLAVASGAKWAEIIPTMVQHRLVDTLGQRPGIVGVIPSSGARTDTRVHLTIKSFEANFDQGEGNAPLATVHYGVTMSNASDRDLLGTYDVKKTVRADAARVSSIVEAMDKANQEALNAIADWLEAPES